MTVKLIYGDEIRNNVLRILSGECVFLRKPQNPILHVISPWLSDVKIDFSNRYISEEIDAIDRGRKHESFLLQDYNIKAINLAHALLLFKLHAAIGSEQKSPKIIIVTLPPKEPFYSPEYVPRMKNFLDFLDEIGCDVFVNPNLHSKVLLTNDLALIGSFNFTSSALLYDREEIGVSINDLDNLEGLEDYCNKLMSNSERFGYTSLTDHGKMLTKKQREIQERLSQAVDSDGLDGLFSQMHGINEERFSARYSSHSITRGWLMDLLVDGLWSGGYGEFLDITGGYDKFVKSYANNLNFFYESSIIRLMAEEKGRKLTEDKFSLSNKFSENLNEKFVKNLFARESVPFIKLQIEPMFSKES